MSVEFDMAAIAPFFPAIFPAIAAICVWFCLRAGKHKRLIDTLPTSKVQGVLIGLTEVKGSVECAHPITSYLAGATCVYYSYCVEEHWSRGSGKNKRDGWTTVASDTRSVPFYLRDDTGALLVRPEGATVEGRLAFSQTCGRSDPLYYAKGPANAIANSTGTRRFTEHTLDLNAPLYIVGQARERQDVIAPEIAAHPDAEMYLISVRTEEKISRGFWWKFWGLGLFGLVLCATPFWARDMALKQPFSSFEWPLTYSLLYANVWFWGWLITSVNSLIALRQRVRQAWAQVDVQLKRRHDLIPNLVSVVTASRDHEARVQEAVAALRSQMTATPPGVAGADYESVHSRLIVLAEAYPDLKTSEAFLQLSRNLSDTEQRIALAREYFNNIATFYNTRLETIPDCWLAQLVSMEPAALMQANGFERAPVKINFNTEKIIAK
jgi:hypothetical protein